MEIEYFYVLPSMHSETLRALGCKLKMKASAKGFHY